jgi:Cytochrome c/c1 heme lyase
MTSSSLFWQYPGLVSSLLRRQSSTNCPSSRHHCVTMGFWGSKPSAPPGQGTESIVGGGATPIVPETKAEVVAQGVNDQKSGSSSGAGGCPMHRADGSYSFDVRALWRAGFPHAPGGSHPLTPEQARSSSAAAPEPLQVTAPTTPSATKPSSGGGCPVKQKSNNASAHQHHPEYNVYAQAIDPTNQMPFQPNQLPAPTQSVPLSTERVASTIPKVRARIVLILQISFCHCTVLNSSRLVCVRHLVDACTVLAPSENRVVQRKRAARGCFLLHKCFTMPWHARESWTIHWNTI